VIHEELPPPLPPETRTVGQLVAESVRIYRDRFWAVLPLGIPLAVLDELSLRHSLSVQILLLWACSPLLCAAYVHACALVAGATRTRREQLTGFAVGMLVFAPVPALMRIYLLPAVAWLALFGLAVPAAVVEGLGFRDALVRGRRLALADYVHALGSLATLTIVYFLTRAALLFLLRSQGDTAERTAGFLGDVVVSPLLFVGPALLYFDQAARLKSGPRPKRRRDADVHPALDVEPARRADPEVEP
jgi:hypothetical protein